MNARRIGRGTLARVLLSALPERLRLEVACEALQTITDPERDLDLRAVATVVADHAAVLQAAARDKIHTRYPHSRRS
jgi:hypothetical protein